MRVVSITLMSLLVLACSKKEKGAPAPSTGTAATPKSHAPAAPGAGEPVQLTGKLLERIDAASYSYLRIQTPGGEVWAAVPETKLAVGADVQVLMPMLMQGFQSETLHRKFDRIYFGTLGDSGPLALAPAPDPGAAPSPHGAGAPSTPPADTAVAPVPKAAGKSGHSIAEAFAQKLTLMDKPVAVRGKVVKYTGGVMHKNWIHLRDGSGSDAAKDNDLTITTDDTAAVGDIVEAQGLLHLDRDFGSGYSYPVIIEDAKLVK